MIVCGVVYAAFWQNGLDAISLWFMQQQFSFSSSWQLVTPSFIHYTPLHLITNLAVWWILCQRLKRYNQWFLLLLFVVSAATSNLSQWLVTGPEFGGLSGVNYALLGYLLIGFQLTKDEEFKVDPLLIGLLLLMIPLGFSELMGKYANFAHLGGLIVGGLFATIQFAVFKKQ